MHQHIIVSGDDSLVTTIVAELNSAGASIVKVATAAELADAEVSRALAVICVSDDDAMNLEIALLARKANPSVRVVARLANDVLRGAVAADNGPGAILDVADLAAPSVVEACLAHTAHPLEAAGIEFVVSRTEAPRAATLREIYGDLAPVAVIRGENSPEPGLVMACPGRDLRVYPGDWTALIGTADELAARGIKIPRRTGTRTRRPWVRRALETAITLRSDVNPMFVRAIAAALLLLVGSTILLRFAYQRPPGMTWIDALYFTTETIATVGYGDFSFVHQQTWLRLFAIMLMFAGVLVTAVLVAFVADLLLSRRFAYSAGRRRARHLRNHVIVVGLGSFGIRVVTDLTAAGHDVAVIERDPNNRFLSTADELDVPVIFGDATLRRTLESARVDHARAVAVLTQDDMVNIETGIVLREMLGPRVMPEVVRPDVPTGAARLRPRAGGRGGAAFWVRKRSLDRRAGRTLVHRRRHGPAGAGDVFGGAALLHGRRNACGPRQRTRRAADVRAFHANPRHRDHPAGCARPAAPTPRRAPPRRRHRIRRRPVSRAAGHPAQGTAARADRHQ